MTGNSNQGKSDKDKSNQEAAKHRSPPPVPKPKNPEPDRYDGEVKSLRIIDLGNNNYSIDAQGRKIIDLDASIKKAGEEAQKEIRRKQSVERAKEAIERARGNLEE